MEDNLEYPKVKVLILSYNGKDLLDDSISSYLANTYSNFEIIVIDNGSIDGTYEYVARNFPEVKIIRIEKNLGYSGGFNFGLNYAFIQLNADYVLVTNNDVKADKNVIKELVKIAKMEDRIGFVTGKVYYYDKPNILQTVGKYEDPIRWNGNHIGHKETDNGQYDIIQERAFADDVFTLVSARLYNEVGGYDETFFLQSEEFEWQARAKKYGYKIMYTPNAKIWHKVSMTIGKRSAIKEYYDARNPIIVILMHQTPDFFRKFFWNNFIRKMVRGSIVLVLKHFDVQLAIHRWRGFISGLWWGLKNDKFELKHFIS